MITRSDGKIESDLHINTIAASARRVDVTLSVSVDSIRETSRGVGEELSVLQSLAVGRDVEAVDGRGLGCVVLPGESLEAGVCYVDVLEIGADDSVSGQWSKWRSAG
jgi:hypothetical protein